MEQILERFMVRSTDDMQRSNNSTRAMIEQMRNDQLASERRAENLAAKHKSDAITAAAANATQMEIMRQAMKEDQESDRRTEARSLNERLVPLIEAAVKLHTPAGVADLLTALREMGERSDAHNAETHAAMARMPEVIMGLQANQGSPPVAVPDTRESLPGAAASNAPPSHLPLAIPAPQRSAEDIAVDMQVENYNTAPVAIQQNTWNGQAPSVHPGVGRGVDQVPAVLGPRGGPGTGGVGQLARIPWGSVYVSESDRERHVQGDRHDQDMAEAAARDTADITARQQASAHERSTRAGVGMLQGRSAGGGLPQAFTQDGMAEPVSLFGKGSNLSNTGTPTQICWDGEKALNRYAGTACNGGVASENVQGKPYSPRFNPPKLDGRNRGVMDSRTLGICAMTYANFFHQKH